MLDGSVVQCALLDAILAVIGSWSPLGKVIFACLPFRAIHDKFSLILYSLRFAGQSVSFFLLHDCCYKQKN